jgi:3D (Asp-Asp-Asp) domain-containing protein
MSARRLATREMQTTPRTHARRLLTLALAVAVFFVAIAACADGSREELMVTATAYNSLPGQTQGDPALGAWGDRLEPGMKAIAVSRDLISMGLVHRTAVKIEGLPGEYLVLDKLNKRWTKRIDVYMGVDAEAARTFGKREVRISWPGSETQ